MAKKFDYHEINLRKLRKSESIPTYTEAKNDDETRLIYIEHDKKRRFA